MPFYVRKFKYQTWYYHRYHGDDKLQIGTEAWIAKQERKGRWIFLPVEHQFAFYDYTKI